MSEQAKPNDSTVLSIRVSKAEKEQIKAEAQLRGHGPSEAAALMLRLGRPLYLKRTPKKFNPVENAA